MNPHDKNYSPMSDASWVLGRLTFALLFGAAIFVVGYMAAEARFKVDPPPCKPVKQKQSQSEYPISKAQIARFVRQFHNQDAGWIK